MHVKINDDNNIIIILTDLKFVTVASLLYSLLELITL